MAKPQDPGTRRSSDMGNVVCALLRMWCRNGCNARVVASRLAFYPPQPPFYRVVDPDGPAPSWEVQNFRPSRTKYVNRVNMLQTRGGDKVACFVFRVARARSTLLYSHGNATDCGAMAPHYSALAIALKVNVVAYDYCGYGSSTGSQARARILQPARTRSRRPHRDPDRQHRLRMHRRCIRPHHRQRHLHRSRPPAGDLRAKQCVTVRTAAPAARRC